MKNLYQTILIGLRGKELSDEEIDILQNKNPGGVILFSRNISDKDQLVKLVESIYSHSHIPPFISIDQEGGLVDRMRDIFGNTPAPTEISSSDSLELIEEFGQLSGDILSSFGINLNFAPVVDIKYSDADNALRSRYWGEECDRVISNAKAYLKGLNNTSVTGCLKHFPGLGRTTIDSHYELPENETDLLTLEKTDLRPFSELCRHVYFVMVAHCHFKAFDEHRIPASLSKNVYRYLRKSTSFEHIAITDDLSMAGVATEYSYEELTVMALEAGADMLCFCNNFDTIPHTFDYIDNSLKSGKISEKSISNSISRILETKSKLGILDHSPEINTARIGHLQTQFSNFVKKVKSDA